LRCLEAAFPALQCVQRKAERLIISIDRHFDFAGDYE
jgi:hypothetical protein